MNYKRRDEKTEDGAPEKKKNWAARNYVQLRPG